MCGRRQPPRCRSNLVVVVGMRQQRVQDQPGAAGVPMRPRRMLLQALDVLPGLAAVVGAEQPGGLDPGIEAAVARSHAPHRLDRLGAGFVGQSLAGMRPALAEIAGFPDCRPEPFIAAAGVDRAGAWVADEMVDRPGRTERALDLPGAPRGLAFEDERTFPGADENEHALGHDFPPSMGQFSLRRHKSLRAKAITSICRRPVLRIMAIAIKRGRRTPAIVVALRGKSTWTPSKKRSGT